MTTGGASDVGSGSSGAPRSDRCPRCAQLGRTCPSCVQWRVYAWSLVTDRGETIRSAAAIMRLAPERVRRLVKDESDRRELVRYPCDSVPVELTRAAIGTALQRDPDLTIGQIAHWLDMRQADFERLYLGTDGQTNKRVNVTSASRLMIALGRAPNELPGC